MRKTKVKNSSRRKVASRGKGSVSAVARNCQRSAAGSCQAGNLVEVFARSPLAGVNLNLDRQPDDGGKLKL